MAAIFFAVGQATCQRNVWAHVLGTAVFEEFAKFPYCGKALAIGQGNGDAFGDFCLGGDGVYLDGVFHKVEVIGHEGFAQGNGDHWGEFAVDFHDEIHIGSGGFAGSGDDFDGGLNDARLRTVLVSACDRIKFDRGKAFGNGGFCIFIHLFGCGAAREQVQANFVAAVAAEQFPDRDLKVFAFDVV